MLYSVGLFFFAETCVKHWADGQNRPSGGNEMECINFYTNHEKLYEEQTRSTGKEWY